MAVNPDAARPCSFAKRVNPSTTSSPVSKTTAKRRSPSSSLSNLLRMSNLAAQAVRGRIDRDAVLVDHLPAQPAGDHQQPDGEDGEPHQAAGLFRRADAQPEVDRVEADDGEVDRHVDERRLSRPRG